MFKLIPQLIVFIIFILFLTHTTKAQLNIKREFRGIWVSTVYHLDFPSRTNLSIEDYKKELTDIVNFAKENGFNAIFFQVRPSADAFYQSNFEPWSEWLHGKQGRAPTSNFDPLSYITEEAHKKMIELHAWVNPYRAIMNTNSSSIQQDHITNRRPDWFIQFAEKKLFNPGIPEVRSYLLNIVMDIARRYPIDGIHFDDYFYPYPQSGYTIEDKETYNQYNPKNLRLSDWRRDNVNQLVQAVHDSLVAYNPNIKFGISPAGVWRNLRDDKNGSATQALSGYDEIYADGLQWLNQNWIDYIAPQIYWSIGHQRADYKTIANWWSERLNGKHLYIGHAFYKIEDEKNDTKWKSPSEIPNQVRLNRTNEQIKGSIFFRYKYLQRNPMGVTDSLFRSLYQKPALLPLMDWKDKIAPEPVQNISIQKDSNTVVLKWQKPKLATDGERASGYIIYRFGQGQVVDIESANNVVSIQTEERFIDENIARNQNYVYLINALDRLQNESNSTMAMVIIHESDSNDTTLTAARKNK